MEVKSADNRMSMLSDIADIAAERFSGEIVCAESIGGKASLLVDPDHIVALLRWLKEHPDLRLELLTDMTAIDRIQERRDFRFEVVYFLYSVHFRRRLIVRARIEEDRAELESAVHIWPSAEWLEREIFEMFGIEFRNHPDLRRLLLPDDFLHWPLRRDYPLQGLGERELSVLEGTAATGDDAVARRWHGVGAGESGERWEEEAQIGSLVLDPGAPMTCGGLRFGVDLEGERILHLRPEPGYRHAGMEKLGEYRTYIQLISVAERLSPRSPACASLAFLLSAEELLGLEPPRKGRYLRVAVAELARIAAHFAWLSELGRAAGAAAAAERALERGHCVGDLLSLLTGSPGGTGFIRIGGVREEPGEGWEEALRAGIGGVRAGLDEIHLLLTENRIWIDRTRGLGKVGLEEAERWSASGPVARSAGSERDLRTDEPYSGYEEFDFDAVCGGAGDVYERYLVRLEEMEQSCRILDQVLEGLPDGPCALWDPEIASQPKERIASSAEALLHHFELWMDGRGLQPPAGAEGHVPTESPDGELGFWLVSDGTDRPCRMRIRTAGFAHYQLFPRLIRGESLADLGLVLVSLGVLVSEVDR